MPGSDWGVSLGPYIFLSSDNMHERYVRHEYGHTVQSRILGPFYLPVVGIPSLALKLVSTVNEDVKDSYFSYWPESWADELGGVAQRL